jgi:hypothetical protein
MEKDEEALLIIIQEREDKKKGSKVSAFCLQKKEEKLFSVSMIGLLLSLFV